MNKSKILILGLIALITSSFASGHVIGYFPGSYTNHPETGTVPPTHVLKHISHAMWFSISLKGTYYAAGSSKEKIAALKAEGAKGHLDTDNVGVYKMQAFVDSTHAAGSKAILVVGGWNISTQEFALMANSASARVTFAKEIAAYVEKYKFDGVDIDWEFPSNMEAYHNFRRMIEALKAELPAGKEVSVAVNPEAIGDMPTEFLNAPDYINIMSYDQRGDAHAPLHVGYQLDQFEYRGAEKKRLVLGVPFYGKTSGWGGTQTPFSSFDANYSLTMDTDFVVDKDNPSATWYFNGPSTIYSKTKYAKDNGYAGVLIWEITEDVAYSNPKSLLRAIAVASGTETGTSADVYTIKDLGENPYSSLAPTSSYTEPSSSSEVTPVAKQASPTQVRYFDNMIEITPNNKNSRYRIYTSKGELIGNFKLTESRSYLFTQPKQAGFYHIELIDAGETFNSQLTVY